MDDKERIEVLLAEKARLAEALRDIVQGTVPDSGGDFSEACQALARSALSPCDRDGNVFAKRCGCMPDQCKLQGFVDSPPADQLDPPKEGS